jgi:hypothetical protein
MCLIVNRDLSVVNVISSLFGLREGRGGSFGTPNLPCVDSLECKYTNLTVIDGDTRSLFVQMPPDSKEVAAQFGERHCQQMISFFPSPVQLNLETIDGVCFPLNNKCHFGHQRVK